MTALRFMGLGEPEVFRCRVYGDAPDAGEDERVRFVRELAIGWVETEDGDPRHAAIEQLCRRAWVDSHFEPASWRGLGDGRVKVWTLTPRGRAELLELVR